jgi:hypothetical protein
MKYLFQSFLLWFAFLTLTACIQVETVVKVKTDGSGTIEETFVMRKDLLEQMKKVMEEMAKGMAEVLTDEEKAGRPQENSGTKPKAEAFDFFDEAKLKENAKNMGEGVTFLSGSKIATDDFEGYKAIYSFEDINKIRINQNPGEKVPSVPHEGGSGTDSKRKEHVVFAFQKGKPAELIIHSPKRSIDPKAQDAEDTQASQNNEKPSDEMAAQVKELFRGMKIALSVAVDGNIVETNATHRDGSKITLVEMDVGKLIEKPELFLKLSQSQLKSLEESKVLMQQIPGIKVDLHEEIRIRFE